MSQKMFRTMQDAHCRHQAKGFCAACVARLTAKAARDTSMAIQRLLMNGTGAAGLEIADVPMDQPEQLAPVQHFQPKPVAMSQVGLPPQKHLETGYVKLGQDWRGVFMRGAEAKWRGLTLASVVNRLLAGRDISELPFNERLEVASMIEMRDLMLGVDETNEQPAVQNLKSYEDCLNAR